MASATDSNLVRMESGHKLNVQYLKCQKSCETTFFFIHGSMGSLQQFDDIIAQYKNKVNIVAYDAMGCGGSEKPTTDGLYTTKSLTSNTIQVFEKYATTKNVLIGHSYGTAQIARLCTHLSRQRKDSDSKDLPVRTISGVILLGTVDVLPESMSTVYRLFSLPVFLLSPMQGWMSRSYVGLAFSPLSNPSLKERALVRAGKNKMYVCKAFYRQFEWATHEDWIATSQYPILMCHGDDDKIASMDGAQVLLKLLMSQFDNKDASKDKADSPPDSDHRRFRLVVINDAGHQLLEEQPTQIVNHMNNFFADVCELSL